MEVIWYLDYLCYHVRRVLYIKKVVCQVWNLKDCFDLAFLSCLLKGYTGICDFCVLIASFPTNIAPSLQYIIFHTLEFVRGFYYVFGLVKSQHWPDLWNIAVIHRSCVFFLYMYYLRSGLIIWHWMGWGGDDVTDGMLRLESLFQIPHYTNACSFLGQTEQIPTSLSQ